MVLIRDERCKRLQWPMGIVQEVFPGRDGVIRAVRIKTVKGMLTRPIQKVHDLEINSCVGGLPPDTVSDRLGGQVGVPEQPGEPDVRGAPDKYTRYGRRVKPPSRLVYK